MWLTAAWGFWGGAVKSLGSELGRTLAAMNPDAAKLVRISRNRLSYVNAVRRTWADNPPAAEMILDHTNAFYVRRDDAPRKGPDKDKPLIVAEAYLDDSMLLSEVNARREMLKLALDYEGVHVAEFRIMGSRYGMRKRHPFADRAARENAGAPRTGEAAARAQDGRADDAALLLTVKRAFCLAIGEQAGAVLALVNAAALDQARTRDDTTRRSSWRWYWLHLYAEDAPRLAAIIEAYEEQIIARARTLDLNIRAIQVHPATEEMRGAQAFPPSGMPVSYRPTQR